VKEALKGLDDLISQYPGPTTALEEAIAGRKGMQPDHVVLGAGSVRLIDGIVQVLCGSGGEVLSFDRSFVAYSQIARAHGRKFTAVPLRGWCCAADGLLELVNGETDVILLANPNNPTGTYMAHNELASLLDTVPPRVWVVVDEAYGEYVDAPDYPNALELMKKHNNLLVIRSFSKAYGLAGLRIGYALASKEVADKLRSNRIPYSLHTFAQPAALAALDDEEFIMQCVAKNARGRDYLYDRLTDMGFGVVRSQANFVFMHFGNEMDKLAVIDALGHGGYMVFDLAHFGQDRSLRMGVGSMDVCQGVVDVLRVLAV
jgi:histidinol-phosphate aminotransferase